jgi:cyclomaltodextrinase
MSIPNWLKDAVFYQIFPDRFANGNPANDPPNAQLWGSAPTLWGFQGGDLEGIRQHLDYLIDLGINALYLTPIFMASSNHRYNTYDYFRIDPKLGDLDVFRQLLDSLHQQGMHLILDGVFNHCGRGFFAFNDLIENQEHSPYRDWFHVKQFPLRPYDGGDAHNYVGWWRMKSLPKFNTKNPQVREYLLNVAKYWTELGIDGWRLDVPNEINDDSFWAAFRETVRSINPQAYLLGEIWEVAPRWIGPDHFDGLMNYPLREALIAFIGEGILSATAFSQRLDQLLNAYPRENIYAQYLLLGSHDIPRIRTLLKGDDRKLRLLQLLQFTFPGIPAIYYGDEIGLEGGKDPDCRRAFPWAEGSWDKENRRCLSRLIKLRKTIPELRDGWLDIIHADDETGTLGMLRGKGEQAVLMVLNASDTKCDLRFPVEKTGWSSTCLAKNLLDDQIFRIEEGHLTLPLAPWSGVLLQPLPA